MVPGRLIAQEIHRCSNRAKEVLVSVDMGALSETLFESELFRTYERIIY